MSALKRKDSGPAVAELQKKLNAAGFNCGKPDGKFGQATEIALKAFQKSMGLLADGIAGSKTLAALNKIQPTTPIMLPEPTGKPVLDKFTVAIVQQMFPATPKKNIQKHLPTVLKAMDEAGLGERDMILMALGTIRAETEGFEPISEFKSKFNTSPGGHPFDLYDNRKDLGNKGKPDGASFKGRGFIQLTGRDNYKKHGAAIGLGNGLIENPDLANDPETAAKLLASFIKSKERKIKEALLDNNLKLARKLINGGSHGLARFSETYRTGSKLVS